MLKKTTFFIGNIAVVFTITISLNACSQQPAQQSTNPITSTKATAGGGAGLPIMAIPLLLTSMHGVVNAPSMNTTNIQTPLVNVPEPPPVVEALPTVNDTCLPSERPTNISSVNDTCPLNESSPSSPQVRWRHMEALNNATFPPSHCGNSSNCTPTEEPESASQDMNLPTASLSLFSAVTNEVFRRSLIRTGVPPADCRAYLISSGCNVIAAGATLFSGVNHTKTQEVSNYLAASSTILAALTDGYGGIRTIFGSFAVDAFARSQRIAGGMTIFFSLPISVLGFLQIYYFREENAQMVRQVQEYINWATGASILVNVGASVYWFYQQERHHALAR